MTCVSKDMVKQYKKIFHNSKYVYAYNIIFNEEFNLKMFQKVNHKWFLDKKKIIVASGTLQSGNVLMILLKLFIC